MFMKWLILLIAWWREFHMVKTIDCNSNESKDWESHLYKANEELANYFIQTTLVPTRSRLLRPQVVSCVLNTSRSWLPDQSVVTVVLLCQVSLLWDQDNTLLSPRPTRPSLESTVVPDVPTVSRKESSELSWSKNKRLLRRSLRNKPKPPRRLRRRTPRRSLPRDNKPTIIY